MSTASGYCYTGKCGVFESADDAKETREARFRIHLFICLFAHTYGIDDLIPYSASQAALLADALRDEDSVVFLRLIHMIMLYEGWPDNDPWKQLAMKHIRIIVEEEDAKQAEQRRIMTDWICKGCSTMFRYLSPKAKYTSLVLEQCLNCVVEGEAESDDVSMVVKAESPWVCDFVVKLD